MLFMLVGLSIKPDAAFAECPEETSDGPVRTFGMVEAMDGIGGSGLVPTDAGSDGIGGAGIFGTLTGFGSLCVNGQRIPYDETVSVTVDSVSESVQALAVGQVIRVTTGQGENGVRAREVDVQHEVVGPVTAVVDGGLEVMGLLVAERVTAAGGVEFVVGDRVAVSGLRRDDGVIVASRIDRASDAQPDLIRGRATEGTDGDDRIGPLRIDASGLAGVSEVPGRTLVKGRWDERAARLVASARTPGPRLPANARVIDGEGYVVRGPSGELFVLGIPLGKRAGEGVREGERVRIRAVRDGAGERPGPPKVRSLRPLSERPLLKRLDRGGRPPIGGPHRTPPRPSGSQGPPRASLSSPGDAPPPPPGNPQAASAIPTPAPDKPSMRPPPQAPRIVRPTRPMPPQVRPRIRDDSGIRPPPDARRRR